MQLLTLLTRSHCRVSDIQLTVKALALFVNNGAETPKGKKKWNEYFINYKARMNKQDVLVKTQTLPIMANSKVTMVKVTETIILILSQEMLIRNMKALIFL